MEKAIDTSQLYASIIHGQTLFLGHIMRREILEKILANGKRRCKSSSRGMVLNGFMRRKGGMFVASGKGNRRRRSSSRGMILSGLRWRHGGLFVANGESVIRRGSSPRVHYIGTPSAKNGQKMVMKCNIQPVMLYWSESWNGDEQVRKIWG